MIERARIGAGLLGLAILAAGCGGAAPAPTASPAPTPAPSPPPSMAAADPALIAGAAEPAAAPDDLAGLVASPSPAAAVSPGASASLVAGASASPSPSADPAASGSPTPSIVALGFAPPPDCRYDDEPAEGDPETDWATMVLDTIVKLPADYVPPKLVSTKKAGLQRGYEVIPAVVDDLRALHEASIEAGAEIAVRWAYRSYAEQEHVFGLYSRQLGEKAARAISARPGHSEHQMGTAIDFRSADSLQAPWSYKDWGKTKPGRWMKANAWRYGFVMSYPKGETDATCYDYEPWHYRYVGRRIAQEIHDSGMTPREYLWRRAHPDQ